MKKINVSITERQAELVLNALRAELRHEGTIIDSNEAQVIRAVMANIKDGLYAIQVKGE